MPSSVQSELARDQLIQVLSPTERHTKTELVHPESLQKALEMALEREIVWAGSSVGVFGDTPTLWAVVQSSPELEKPA